MCGIIGVAIKPTEDRTEEDIKAIRFITLSMWLDSISRGRDAAGLAMIDKNKNWYLTKAPMNAVEFRFNQKNIVDQFIKRITTNTTMLIGHVRLGTKGNKLENKNNHPIDVGNVLGVHNGVISNDDELAEELEFEKTAEVDSEIIFNLLNQSLVRNKFDIPAVEEVFPKLQGSFAIASFSKSDPYHLLLAKRDKPIHCMYCPDKQVLFFASEYGFVEDAIYACNEMDTMFELGCAMVSDEFTDFGKVYVRDEGIMLNVNDFGDEPDYDRVDVKVWDRTSGAKYVAPAKSASTGGGRWPTTQSNSNRRSSGNYGRFGFNAYDWDEDDYTSSSVKTDTKEKAKSEEKKPATTTTTIIDTLDDVEDNPFENIEELSPWSSDYLITNVIKKFQLALKSDLINKQIKRGAMGEVAPEVDLPSPGRRGVGKKLISGIAYEIGYLEAAERYFALGFKQAMRALNKYYKRNGYSGWY